MKDLSRFGRNYIQVGQYIDYIFPAYGIRFIALSDNVDTADRTSAGMDMMPIMNVFNEWHAANTSKKIRAVLEANWRKGKYTNWAYPYGYRAGSDENRTAIIDEEAAGVVRRIYDMRLQGNSIRNRLGRPPGRRASLRFFSVHPCIVRSGIWYSLVRQRSCDRLCTGGYGQYPVIFVGKAAGAVHIRKENAHKGKERTEEQDFIRNGTFISY